MKIFAGNSTSPDALVQTLELTIPSARLALPGKAEDQYRLIGTGGSSGGYADRFARCDSGDTGGTWRLFGAGDGSAKDTVYTVAVASGDSRETFLRNVPSSLFADIPYNPNSPNVRCSFCANSGFSFFPRTRQGRLIENVSSSLFANLLPVWVNGVHVNGDPAMPVGDFDNGIASMPDGPYINKPDEGDLSGMSVAGEAPYFKRWGTYSAVNTTYFSPNRQVPSSGMLGSLPTGVKANKPWRTLLFGPIPRGSIRGARPARSSFHGPLLDAGG